MKRHQVDMYFHTNLVVIKAKVAVEGENGEELGVRGVTVFVVRLACSREETEQQIQKAAEKLSQVGLPDIAIARCVAEIDQNNEQAIWMAEGKELKPISEGDFNASE